MKVALVAAPEAGQDALARFIDPSIMVVTKTWVTYLAKVITDDPAYVDSPAFINDLKSVRAAMSSYDHIFYIPIYAWNIVDNGENKIDEDYRVQYDYNIVKILNTCNVFCHTVPEAPAWDRAKFVMSVVE